MIRRYYDPVSGIDLLPDVPTEAIDEHQGSVLRGVLCASAISGGFLLMIFLTWTVLP